VQSRRGLAHTAVGPRERGRRTVREAPVSHLGSIAKGVDERSHVAGDKGRANGAALLLRDVLADAVVDELGQRIMVVQAAKLLLELKQEG